MDLEAIWPLPEEWSAPGHEQMGAGFVPRRGLRAVSEVGRGEGGDGVWSPEVARHAGIGRNS